MHKKIFLAAGFLGMLAVFCGAFGSHMLKPKVTAENLAIFQTAVQYHFYHVLALLGTGLLYRSYRDTKITAAALMFLLGIIFFSICLYVYVWSTQMKDNAFIILKRVTPVGGAFFMLGWLFVFLYFLKNQAKNVSSRRSNSTEE